MSPEQIEAGRLGARGMKVTQADQDAADRWGWLLESERKELAQTIANARHEGRLAALEEAAKGTTDV